MNGMNLSKREVTWILAALQHLSDTIDSDKDISPLARLILDENNPHWQTTTAKIGMMIEGINTYVKEHPLT